MLDFRRESAMLTAWGKNASSSLAVLVAPLVWVGFSATQAQGTVYALGTTALLVGPGEGTNSVVLGVTPATATWTAIANTNWLHLSAANKSGIGSTNVVFTYDANRDATRCGTLTIGSQTLNVTQAGSTYIAARLVTALVSSGLNEPAGVAVDGVGNVYIADSGNNAIKEWTAANSNVVTLVSSGLNGPGGVALDREGNIYIADSGNGAIKRWTAASRTVTTFVSSGFNCCPLNVAVDGAGNLYLANWNGYAIDEWTAANNTVATLAWPEICVPKGVAVDGAGNVYFGVGPGRMGSTGGRRPTRL